MPKEGKEGIKLQSQPVEANSETEGKNSVANLDPTKLLSKFGPQPADPNGQMTPAEPVPQGKEDNLKTNSLSAKESDELEGALSWRRSVGGRRPRRITSVEGRASNIQ